jgi:PAS domain S-box-containing protein
LEDKKMANNGNSKLVFRGLILNKWIPLTVVIVLLIFISMLSWTLERNEKDEQNNRSKIQADNLKIYIEDDFQNRITSMQRMVKRWQVRKNIHEIEFVSDANAYIEDAPGYQAIEWIDKNYIITWIVPPEGNEAAVGLDISFEEKRRITLEQAKDLKIHTMSPPIDLVQGGKGFLLYFPIFVDEEFDGFIVAVFNIEKWLSYVFRARESDDEIRDFRAQVNFDDVDVFQQENWNELKEMYTCSISNLNILNHNFSIKVVPTHMFIKSTHTMMPESIFVIGIMISVLLFTVMTLFQKATKEEGKTRVAKEALESEVEERKIAQERLKNINRRMVLAADSAGIGVWELDLLTNELVWDEWMFRLYGIKSDDFGGAYEAWEQGVHPDDRERSVSDYEKAVSGEKEFNLEFRVVHPNKSVREIKANAVVIRDQDGKAFKMMGINYDITEQKQAGQAKEEAAKLQIAVQLAQAVAHEFRQPMTTLNLISSIMMIKDIDIETAQKSIKKIPDAVGKINRLVDELMSLQEVKTMHYTNNMDIIDIAKSSKIDSNGEDPVSPQ